MAALKSSTAAQGRHMLFAGPCLAAIVCFASAAVRAAPANTGPIKAVAATVPVRTFDFTYAATITGLPPGALARIWIPLPPSGEDQQVEVLERRLPASALAEHERISPSGVLYFESKAQADGTIPLSLTYRVTRHEVDEEDRNDAASPDRFLQPDRLVPIGGKPASLLKSRTLPDDQIALAKLLYDLVDDHLQYRKDRPGWGRGDAAWACESGFGNCTDFHSLFISLARTEHLPAKFEIGFSIPAARAGAVTGYHCWAKFRPKGHGWIGVDISEANQHPSRRGYFFGHLDENRVMFTTGRDLVLDPPQHGPPVNFFVYPYVEVGDAAVPAVQVQMHCAYQDVPSPSLHAARP